MIQAREFLQIPFHQVLGDGGFPGLRKLRALDLSNSQRLNLVSAQAFQVSRFSFKMNKRVHNLQDLSNLAWLSLSGCSSLSLQSGALLPLTGLRTLHLADLGWTQLDRCNLYCEAKTFFTSLSKSLLDCSLSQGPGPVAELAKSGPCRQPTSLRLSTCLAKRCPHCCRWSLSSVCQQKIFASQATPQKQSAPLRQV